MTSPPTAILTFAEARRLVDRMLSTMPGRPIARPDGYENDTFYRVLVNWPEALSFDAPVILVEKATGLVRQLPWFEGVTGPYAPEKMRPVSDA